MSLITSGLLTLDIEIDSAGGAADISLVLRGPPHTQVTLGVWRMNESGPTNMLAAPAIPLTESCTHRFPLRDWPDGLYVTMLHEALMQPAYVQLIDPFAAHAFELKGGTATILLAADAAIETALAAQAVFREREIRADGFIGQNRLALRVVVEGCSLDYPQVFEGGRVEPLALKLGPESMLTVVNNLLQSSEPFGNPSLTETYSRSHHLCLVTFVNVQAQGISEALRAVEARLDRVLGALAEDRYANPQPLAYVSESREGQHQLSFPVRVYGGNRVAGLGPGVTALLDLIETASDSDPWIDFALRLMHSVRLQTNSEMQLFQAWSLIEAAAKRKVPSDKSIIILNDAGDPINTSRGTLSQSTDVGRVIVYLRDHVSRNVLSALMLTGTPDFYDQVRMLYDGRNRVAHEGGLAAPGSQLINIDPYKLAWTATNWAAAVLHYEIRRAAK